MSLTSVSRRLELIPAAFMVAGLCACLPAKQEPVAPKAVVAKAAVIAPPLSLPQSPASTKASAYYAQMQERLLGQGLLRTDGGGIDTPFTDNMLAENFIRIALYDEYQRRDGRFTQVTSRLSSNRSYLRRWESPVLIEVVFGASVPAEKRSGDLAKIKSYAQRLSDVTGHPIAVVPAQGNFIVHVVGEDERGALTERLRRDLPALSVQDAQDVAQMPQSTYCLVYAAAEGDSGIYERAVAVVRAEHPDLLRQSCYHEEIAQGLGLANDSPYARPSIFNDDEEFALLTTMDEMLLKILYDPALKPGISEAEARPIVKRLASLLKG